MIGKNMEGRKEGRSSIPSAIEKLRETSETRLILFYSA
jgi:hypothetical protein